MESLEALLLIFLAAVALAALARRVGAPYPVFLAIGGAALALLPGAPTIEIAPDLVLALFVAPILMDAAYDTSVRDLRDNWPGVASLVIGAVGLTTAGVAAVVHTMVPTIPWAAAIALGALVAPPDAVAVTAVLGQVRLPHRIVTVLNGESLLNDASSLLIYRLAVGSVAAGTFSPSAIAPAFLLGIAGSLVAGPILGWLMLRATAPIRHVPTAVILQFVVTIGVWILAEHVGLSGVLTTVLYAMTIARTAPRDISAHMRIPSYVVWDAVVFALTILAFIFVGLQLSPILESLAAGDLSRYIVVSSAVVATVIGIRIAWVMSFNALVRWRHRVFGFHPPRQMTRPTFRSGLAISWSGMRGILTLAAALALPVGFPYRGLIVFVAFAVVLGTLTIQGLTLKPLLAWLNLEDDDPVGRELETARGRALQAAMEALGEEPSPARDMVRRELKLRLAAGTTEAAAPRAASVSYAELRQRAVEAAREALIRMRDNEEIGDDAFREVERDLDLLEITGEAPED